MSTTKKYIDQAGVKKIFDLIKANYAGKTPFENLAAVVGLDKLSTDTTSVDAKTFKARLESLEALAGTTSVDDQIKAAIAELDATISSTANADGTAATASTPAVASTQKVQVTVTETDGKITAVSVSEKDIASKVVLDEEIARAKAAEKVNADDIDALEALHATGKTVAQEVTAGIEALDADIKSSDVEANKGANVNVEVVEADGKITAVKV